MVDASGRQSIADKADKAVIAFADNVEQIWQGLGIEWREQWPATERDLHLKGAERIVKRAAPAIGKAVSSSVNEFVFGLMILGVYEKANHFWIWMRQHLIPMIFSDLLPDQVVQFGDYAEGFVEGIVDSIISTVLPVEAIKQAYEIFEAFVHPDKPLIVIAWQILGGMFQQFKNMISGHRKSTRQRGRDAGTIFFTIVQLLISGWQIWKELGLPGHNIVERMLHSMKERSSGKGFGHIGGSREPASPRVSRASMSLEEQLQLQFDEKLEQNEQRVVGDAAQRAKNNDVDHEKIARAQMDRQEPLFSLDELRGVDHLEQARSKLPKLPQSIDGKTVSAVEINKDGQIIRTLSGWDHKKPGYTQATNEVLAAYDEMGVPRKHSFRDQGVEGRYHASHAESQMVMIVSDEPIPISKPQCEVCQKFFRNRAVYEGRTIMAGDPDVSRAFRPDGTIAVYDRHGGLLRVEKHPEWPLTTKRAANR